MRPGVSLEIVCEFYTINTMTERAHESQTEVPSSEFSPESRERKNELRALTLFVVRHGETEYLERAHVMDTGRWNPGLRDLTIEGEQVVGETAEEIAAQLDPKEHILVFYSSPRARALRSQEILEGRLRAKGFEVLEQDEITKEILRSGGDAAPLVGEGNIVQYIDGKKPHDWNIEEEDLQATYGVRFREFLGHFSAVDKQKLLESIADPEAEFHGKIPVYIAVTHGEVTHAGINPQDEYEASFLGTAFPEYERMKLLRGKVMKIDFDLEDPGAMTLSLPSLMSPDGIDEAKKLRLDQQTGELSLVEDLSQE